jgi:glycosyltransferase involved in cell wall biosynthesis
MRIHWTADYDIRGNGYGYTMHQKNLRAGLEGQGVVMDPDSDLVVHIVTPPTFNPIPGKYNVLYTMYEMAAIPEEWIEPLQMADLVVVPNHHNRHLFARYYKGPIEVVWEGVKPEKFTLVKRTPPKPGEKLRFLWLGASNPRKGYEQVCMAWQEFYGKNPEVRPNVELYLKTTQPMTETRNLGLKAAGAIFDNRDLPIDELIELYHSAHVFLFPSMGEGWGLTLHEAMATGMPVIYTPWSAMRDWVPEKYAYPLKFTMKNIDTIRQTGDGVGEKYHSAPAAWPDWHHLARRMYQLYGHYEEAAERGYKAAQVVREITWERSAREFIDKVTPHYEKWRGNDGCEDNAYDWLQRKVRDLPCVEDRAEAYASP